MRMREDGKIDYVEQPGGDLAATKAFYTAAFGWTFQDWGEAYCDYNEGLNGGFTSHPDSVTRPMVILYAHDLEAMETRVKGAGGVITRGIMSFPGGRRFHFKDPAGNELGVWSQA
jgi:predicted enzyme related to lactoylglutathione lyase